MERADRFGIRGQTLAFRADPFEVAPDAAMSFESDGIVVVHGGCIEYVGPAAAALVRYPGLRIESYPGDLIMAGFVDTHVHYPQTGIIASYGAQLIDWLNRYTFPAELAFADARLARTRADFFLDECLRNGVTTASVYCTVHPQSVDAFFEAADARGFRMAAGKVLMDRNAPAGLTETAERGYDETKDLIARWHGKGRLTYAITPRFAPTSSPEQLAAAGALWRMHPDCLMQTHLSESPAEIAWVRSLFPEAPDYLGVYERHGLVGPGANFGHAIHLGEPEIARLFESGSGVSHCPTSNLFIGSGLFDMARMTDRARAIPVGLASDVGGGSSFSMFATMRAAYEIAQLRGVSLHPARAYYLATLGGAKVLRLDDRIGNLAPGYEADIVIIDLKSRPLLADRVERAGDLSEVLFAEMILADDRAIRAVFVGGRRAYVRDDA